MTLSRAANYGLAPWVAAALSSGCGHVAHTPQRGPKVVICIYFVESKYKLLFWEGGLEMRLSREWMGLATGAVDGSPPTAAVGRLLSEQSPQQTEMLLYASALATSPICYFVYFPTRSAVEADCTGRGGALLPPLQHLRPPGGVGTTIGAATRDVITGLLPLCLFLFFSILRPFPFFFFF